MTINLIRAAYRGLDPLQMWGARALEGPGKWPPLGKKIKEGKKERKKERQGKRDHQTDEK